MARFIDETERHNLWRKFLQKSDTVVWPDQDRLDQIENVVMGRIAGFASTPTTRSFQASDILRWSSAMVTACLCGILLAGAIQTPDNGQARIAALYTSAFYNTKVQSTSFFAEPWTQNIH
jgi:hypothetical protein